LWHLGCAAGHCRVFVVFCMFCALVIVSWTSS
jgi:hypothetical protein